MGAHGINTKPIALALTEDPDRLQRLAIDQYGNYVVQIALRTMPATTKARLVALLLPALPSMCTHKGGANVAEVAIKFATLDQLERAESILKSLPLESNCYPAKH